MSRLSGDCVIVLGMHRSGTSGLANALQNLGLFLGQPDELLFATDQNAEGHFELTKLLYLNEQLLWHLGQAYNRVRPLPAGWETYPRIEGFMAEALSILEASFAGQKLWGWKEPRTSLFVPLYLRALARTDAKLHFVLGVRNPVDVMASLAKREGYEPLHSLGLWLRYTLASLHDTIGQRRALVLYEDLLCDPKACLNSTVALVEGWRPTDEQWHAAVGAVRPALSHHRSERRAMDDLPPVAVKTFELCIEAAKDPSGFQGGRYDDRIRLLYGECTTWTSMLIDPPADGDLIVRWGQAGRPEMERRIFRPTHEWRTYNITLKPDPGSVVAISFVNAVASVLLKRIEWVSAGKASPAPIMAGHDARMIPGPERQLVVVGGPEQLLVKAPDTPGEHELAIEFSLELSTDTPIRIAANLIEEIDQLKKRLGGR